MLFLLNDVVFDLEETCPVSPADARRFDRLGFDYVIELGCELFSENPLLHKTDPVRARRLAYLIAGRQPGVNAAMFAAPETDCAPDLVEPRFAALPPPIMRQLKTRASRGGLDAVAADKAVWGRMAA